MNIFPNKTIDLAWFSLFKEQQYFKHRFCLRSPNNPLLKITSSTKKLKCESLLSAGYEFHAILEYHTPYYEQFLQQ